jgi:hypothetical protein
VTPPWHPEERLSFNTIVLAQADLDYDVWYQSQVVMTPPVARMLWMSVTPYVDHGDDTLEKRELVRAKAGATSKRSHSSRASRESSCSVMASTSSASS